MDKERSIASPFKLNDRLLNLWELLQTSLWFVPTVMVLLALGLSLVALTLDENLVSETLTASPWVFTGSPEAARQILSTIASSIITVAALAFSMTMVSLTLASSQFGPRILRNFIRDTGNQLVLGTFLATYIYCLIVLRSVRGLEGHAFVPQVSVSIAFLLLLTSIGVLIYFIHHVVTSIQADYIINGISRELQDTICRLYPEQREWDKERPSPPGRERSWLKERKTPILAQSNGYLQTIDYDELLNVAVDFDAQFLMNLRPGQYIIRNQPLLTVSSRVAEPEKMMERINQAFIVGIRPTPIQDVEFSVDQLVEIAVRALSPGINDPFTAMSCLDHLGSVLALLFRREMPSPWRFDEKGYCRLFIRNITISGVIDAAFNQIRQYGRTSVPVMVRMLETIARIAPEVRTKDARDALYRQACMIEKGAREAFPEPYDRQAIAERFQEVRDSLTFPRDCYPNLPPLGEPEEVR